MVRLVSLPLAPHRAKPIHRRTVKATGSAAALLEEAIAEVAGYGPGEPGLTPRPLSFVKKREPAKQPAKRSVGMQAALLNGIGARSFRSAGHGARKVSSLHGK